MSGLGHQDSVLVVSVLACTITHQTRPTMSHDVRLLDSYEFIKLLYYMVYQPYENYQAYAKVCNGFDLWVRS